MRLSPISTIFYEVKTCPECGFTRLVNYNSTGMCRSCSTARTNVRLGRGWPILSEEKKIQRSLSISAALKGNTNASGNRSEEFREKMSVSSSLNSSFRNSETRLKCQKTMISRYGVSNPAHLSFHGTRRFDHNGVKMRSRYETRFASVLDSFGIPWEYEAHRFNFKDGSGSHVYAPDFFLPSLNLFVEVKSDYTYLKDSESVEFQLSAVRDQGCKILLIRDTNWSEVLATLRAA